MSKSISEITNEFTSDFMKKYNSLISGIAKKYLIPNRYTVEDIKQYISERIIQILSNRLRYNKNQIDNPEKYFKSCIEFYCIEYQRMHGFIFDLPKRPRKNCEEDELEAKSWGFKYLGDVTIDEYNSMQELTLDKDLEYGESAPKLTEGIWDILTGCLTEPEAQVIDCIYNKKMTWTETSEYLNVAQSTCWFRKNRAIKKIFDLFDDMPGEIQHNLKLALRGDSEILGLIKDGNSES